MKRRKILLCAVVFLAFLTSCATTGKAAASVSPPMLPEGARVYGKTVFPAALPFIDRLYPEFAQNKYAKDFFSRTDALFFGFYNGNEGKNKIYAVSTGNYPVSKYNSGFSFAKGWTKKTLEGEKWWESPNIGRITFTKSAACFTTGAFSADSFQNADIEGSADAVLAVLLPKDEVKKMMGAIPLPIDINVEKALFSITPHGADYTAKLHLSFNTASEAKALGALFSLARAAISRGNSTQANGAVLLFVQGTVKTEGAALEISTEPMTVKEAAAFLATLDGTPTRF